MWPPRAPVGSCSAPRTATSSSALPSPFVSRAFEIALSWAYHSEPSCHCMPWRMVLGALPSTNVVMVS